jgi:phage baseplate assembly protein W
MIFPKTQDLPNVVFANNETAQMGKSFLFDFTTGDFFVQNGKMVECNGIEAIKVWIEKILRTEKGRFKIYDDTDYGCHLEDLIIGSNYSMSFIESELKREIEDALMQNPNIKAVSDFTLERTKSGITVSMEVETIDAGTNTFTATL